MNYYPFHIGDYASATRQALRAKFVWFFNHLQNFENSYCIGWRDM